MSRIIIIIMWSKSQVPLYMKTIKCDDVNCYLSFSTNIYYKDIESIFPFNTYSLLLQRNTHRFYYHIQSLRERAMYVLRPKIFPPSRRTLTINSISTSTIKRARGLYSFSSKVYLYIETGTLENYLQIIHCVQYDGQDLVLREIPSSLKNVSTMFRTTNRE